MYEDPHQNDYKIFGEGDDSISMLFEKMKGHSLSAQQFNPKEVCHTLTTLIETVTSHYIMPLMQKNMSASLMKLSQAFLKIISGPRSKCLLNITLKLRHQTKLCLLLLKLGNILLYFLKADKKSSDQPIPSKITVELYNQI